MRKRLIMLAAGLGLVAGQAAAQSATPGPGLPNPANSPTAGDQYRNSRDPGPGRRSATPAPGLPDPADSPTAGKDRGERDRPNRFDGPVFGAPGQRSSDAPFAPQTPGRYRPRSGPRYYGGQRSRERRGFAEPDFAIDRRDQRDD
jgi:hypothetical protein